MHDLDARDAVRARTFEEMSDAVLIADDARRYVDVNDAACALLGRARHELLQMRIDDVFPGPGDVEDAWRRFLAEGSQRGEFSIQRGNEVVTVDYRARARIAPNRHLSVLRDVTAHVRARQDAERCERELRRLAEHPPHVVARLGREDRHLHVNGAIERISGASSATELSFGEQSAREVEQARAVLDALLTAAPVGFAFLDRALRFQRINPALAAVNGLPVDAHIGKTPMEILPGLAADFIRSHAEAVFRTGEPQTNLELAGETPALPGVMRSWIEHWYPVTVDGEIIGVGIIVEEVTEKRAAEARLGAAAVLRDRLMAIVSHDLRNPLNAIVMAASLIAIDEAASRQTQSMAGKILGSSRRMTRLIEQLLDFVRVDQAGGLHMARGPMVMKGAVDRAAEECHLAFPDGIVEVEAVGNTAGEWDEDRILQVLTNLVSNALQHGGGRARVRIDGSAPEVVRVEVWNGGTPISAEMLPIVFDPFRRAAEGLMRRGGLGLGLYITRSIVEALRGTIEVRSSEEGTIFALTLPRR